MLVTDEADLILKEAKLKVGSVEGMGPGLTSTSPARRRRQKVKKLEVRR